MSVIIVPATKKHARELADNIAEKDGEEVKEAGYSGAYSAILSSMNSTTFPIAGIADGKCICIFGIAQYSLLSRTGIPWFLSSKDLPKYGREIARRSRKVLKEMNSNNLQLFNYVDSRQEKALRWFKWLGFKVEPNSYIGINGIPFHYISLGE